MLLLCVRTWHHSVQVKWSGGWMGIELGTSCLMMWCYHYSRSDCGLLLCGKSLPSVPWWQQPSERQFIGYRMTWALQVSETSIFRLCASHYFQKKFHRSNESKFYFFLCSWILRLKGSTTSNMGSPRRNHRDQVTMRLKNIYYPSIPLSIYESINGMNLFCLWSRLVEILGTVYRLLLNLMGIGIEQLVTQKWN